MTTAISLIIGLIIGAGAVFFLSSQRLQRKLKYTEGQLERAKRAFDETESLRKEQDKKLQTLQQAQTQLRDLEQREQSHRHRLQDLERQIQDYQAQIQDYQAQIEDLRSRQPAQPPEGFTPPRPEPPEVSPEGEAGGVPPASFLAGAGMAAAGVAVTGAFQAEEKPAFEGAEAELKEEEVSVSEPGPIPEDLGAPSAAVAEGPSLAPEAPAPEMPLPPEGLEEEPILEEIEAFTEGPSLAPEAPAPEMPLPPEGLEEELNLEEIEAFIEGPSLAPEAPAPEMPLPPEGLEEELNLEEIAAFAEAPSEGGSGEEADPFADLFESIAEKPQGEQDPSELSAEEKPDPFADFFTVESQETADSDFLAMFETEEKGSSEPASDPVSSPLDDNFRT